MYLYEASISGSVPISLSPLSSRSPCSVVPLFCLLQIMFPLFLVYFASTFPLCLVLYCPLCSFVYIQYCCNSNCLRLQLIPMPINSCLCLPVFGDIVAELAEYLSALRGCRISVDMLTLGCWVLSNKNIGLIPLELYVENLSKLNDSIIVHHRPHQANRGICEKTSEKATRKYT